MVEDIRAVPFLRQAALRERGSPRGTSRNPGDPLGNGGNEPPTPYGFAAWRQIAPALLKPETWHLKPRLTSHPHRRLTHHPCVRRLIVAPSSPPGLQLRRRITLQAKVKRHKVNLQCASGQT